MNVQTLIKGLLIFSPALIYGMPMFDRTLKKQKLITWIFGIILLIIVFSPFSFTGWLIDYVVFFIGATLMLKTLATKPTKTWAVIAQITATLLLIGYVTINSLFGARLIDEYEKGNLTFRIYRIPDMVTAPTHRLQITQTWGLVEKYELEERVQGANIWGTNCKYDFDLVTRMIIRDNCKDFELKR